MATPKNKWTKWTPEEEDAVIAGINKHGIGKWIEILKDPEFSRILRLRTNVHLKDKWRSGLSSSDKGKAATLAKSQQSTNHEAIKLEITRLDNLILETIAKLKERLGSNKTTIASWIEKQCSPPADFKQLLSDRLKDLTISGKLIKAKNKYRRAPTSASLLIEEQQREKSRAEIKPIIKSQVDAELELMRTMTARKAASVAARAVAEAEAAIEEAEAAAREAEAAEAVAEAAEAYAEATRSSFRRQRTPQQFVDSLKYKLM